MSTTESKKPVEKPAKDALIKQLLSIVFQNVHGMVPEVQMLIIKYYHLQVSEGTFENFELAQFQDKPISMVCDGPFLFMCAIHDGCITAFNMENNFSLVRSINISPDYIAVSACNGFLLIAGSKHKDVMMFDTHKSSTDWTLIKRGSFDGGGLRVDDNVIDMAASDEIVCIGTSWLSLRVYDAKLKSNREYVELTFRKSFLVSRLFSCGVSAGPSPTIFAVHRPLTHLDRYLQMIPLNSKLECKVLVNNVRLEAISVKFGRVYVLTRKENNCSVLVFDDKTGEALPSIALNKKVRTMTITDDGSWLLYLTLDYRLTAVPL